MTEMPEEELIIYQRKMPHWRLAGSVYFVTWRLEFSQPALTPDERAVIMSALKHFDNHRYDLYAWVVMHNHVHALVKPLEKYRLQALVQSWKSFTAHKFSQDYGRKVPIWQEEYFDRIVRDEKEFLDKAQYILNNPLKQWPEAEDYPWVWIKEDLTASQ
ncbi:MAG: REP-associated tyrosine transposase [Desulfobaccales bacterium]